MTERNGNFVIDRLGAKKTFVAGKEVFSTCRN
jgi:hypothetical protein